MEMCLKGPQTRHLCLVHCIMYAHYSMYAVSILSMCVCEVCVWCMCVCGVCACACVRMQRKMKLKGPQTRHLCLVHCIMYAHYSTYAVSTLSMCVCGVYVFVLYVVCLCTYAKEDEA